MRSRQPWAALVACLTASGCAPTLEWGEPREARSAIPTHFYRAQSTTDPSQPPTVGTREAAVQKGRVAIFDSAELQSLIEAALQGNQELNGRMQEIIIAQSEVMAREGEYLPKLHGRVATGVEKVGKYTSQGVSDEAHGVPEVLGNFTFGLASSWEVDVWKKLRNAAKAASLHHRATIEGRNFLVTQLVAEIARSYYELIAIDNQLEVLQRNIRLQEDALQVIRIQKEASQVTELPVQRFEAEVLKNKSRLYDVEQERIQIENRINFLVGRYPQPVARDARRFRDPLPAEVRSGIPSQLLGNRPDVRQAELELEAAKMDVKSAKASFYPALSIDAGAGYQSFNAAHLVDTPDSVFFGVEAAMTMPLLNRKGIEAEYRSASARQVQAVYDYERTVLQAYSEVASQLAMIDNLQKSYDLQVKQVETLGRSTETSYLLFQSARADYMEVLLTRRDSLEAELELIETRKRQLQARVNVYQALGGGWR